MYFNIRISKDRLVDLIPLYKNAFNLKIKLETVSSKFNNKNFGADYIGFITYFDSKPVSYYGVFPLFAIINNTKHLVSQSGDTMTHSEHLGRGLFIIAAKETYKLCIEEGVTGVFGFPSKSSFGTFKKRLNWEFNEHINRYSFFIPTLPISFLFSKNSLTNKIYKKWVKFVLFFFNNGLEFNNSLLDYNYDCICHDDVFWKYKLQNPDIFLIQINSINIVIKFDGKMYIGDMSSYDSPKFRNTIFKLKILSLLTFNNFLNFYTSPSVPADVQFSKICQPKIALPIGYLDFTTKSQMKNLKFTFFDFDTF